MNNIYYSQLVSVLYELNADAQRKEKGLYFFLGIGGFFLISLFVYLALIFIKVLNQSGSIVLQNTVFIFISFVVPICLIWLVLYRINFQRRRLEKFLGEAVTLFMMYQEELNDIQNITQILVSVEKIHSTLQEILILSGKLTKKYPKVIVMIHTFTQDIGNTVLKTLLNLGFDLQIRLTEQQKNLEGAKSEIEANIQGTTELNQVSELQKARLDRQIEQFEELRRVLVKV